MPVGISISPDSGTTFYAGGANYNAIARLGDNKFVVAYADENDSLKGKVIVGTRAGTSITVNAGDVVTFEEGEVMEIGITALSSTLFVISYVDVSDSSNPKVIAGTVSGTTITLGTAGSYWGQAGTDTAICTMDSTHFTVVVVYSSDFVAILNCSVSGTTITPVASVSAFSVSGVEKCDIAGLNSTDFVICYNEGTHTIAKVGRVDYGVPSITMGASSDYGVLSSQSTPLSIASFDNLHFVIALFGYAVAGSVDEATLAITQGASIDLGVAPTYWSICTMDSTHFVISLADYSSPYKGELVAGSLSGSTTLTMDAQGVVIFDTHEISYTGICRLTSDYFIVGFKHP
jgi:hypothetical protein